MIVIDVYILALSFRVLIAKLRQKQGRRYERR